MGLIIGIAGEFGAGKDASAEVLTEQFGFTLMKFSTHLKRECWEAILHKEIPRGAPDDIRQIIMRTEDPDLSYMKPSPPDIRRLHQWWGSQYRRAQDPKYWINLLQQDRADLGNPDTVITDPRFQNEGHDYIKVQEHGLIWKVVNPRRETYKNAVLDDHCSEQWVRTYTGWNAVIMNDGTLDQLHQKVWDLAKCETEIAQAREALTMSCSASEFNCKLQWLNDWNQEKGILGYDR